TPMPAIFVKGKPATLASVLSGDVGKQKDALWSYLSLGRQAPSPKPPPLLPVTAPLAGEPPLIAQIPIHLPDRSVLESLCVLSGSHDLIVYDLGSGRLHSCYTGAQILRGVQGRLRKFTLSGIPVGTAFPAESALQLAGP